jgi:hypothetical protein
MRRKIFAVGVALVLGTANMTTSAMAFGHGGGWGGGGHGGGHFVRGGFPGRGFAIARGRFVHAFRRNFAFRRTFAFGGLWPYSGYDYVPTDAFGDMTYATPETAGFVPGPPPAPACQRSEEIVTVPSEKGGTRQIKIVRCP